MKAFLAFRTGRATTLLFVLPLCPAILLFSAVASVQSSAENSGQSTAATSAASVQAKPDAPATPANTVEDPAKPQHLAPPLGPPPDLANRQALEQHAGKNACKLLLRSTPNAAQIYVDGAFVGESPLLLIVSPGKYQIEMRGRRLEFGERAVDLLPRETREVALSLTSRYPTRVTVH